MVSWSSLQSLIFLFGPIILPKAIGVVRSISIRRTSTKALDHRLKFGLNVLFLALVLALASSLPYFQDENIITATGARLLLTSNDVLTRRLEAFRLGQGISNISDNDLALLSALKTKEGRLLYAVYGPRPLIECLWCTPSDPVSYLYYMIPTMVVSHIANIIVLGFVTSSLSSKAARSLRIYATVAGLGVGMGEILFLYSVNILENTQAITPTGVNWYHWRLINYRGLAIATLNLVFCIALYLNGTGRIGSTTISDQEKIEAISKSMDVGLGHVRTGLFVKSTTIRNEPTFTNISEFWKNESTNRRRVAEQLDSTRSQVLERIDLDSINDEAFKFTSGLMEAIIAVKNPAAPPEASSTHE